MLQTFSHVENAPSISYKREMLDIRFKFAVRKAVAALHWMVAEHPQIDLHAALKACYFADKRHLNQYGRPIFGATYKAMKFGPVPLEIYEMAKGEPLWLAETGSDAFPWQLQGYRLRLVGNEQIDLSVLSDSDKECFEAGLRDSLGMNFTERTAATHGPDWQAADLGIMRYEDMLELSPDRQAVLQSLQERSRFMRL